MKTNYLKQTALAIMLVTTSLGFSQSCAIFNENYTAATAWTLDHPATSCAGNAVDIAVTNAGTFNYNSCNDGTLNRMWAPLVSTLSNTSWTADFDFILLPNSGALTTYAPAHVIAGFTAGSADTYNTVTTPCNGGVFPTTNQDAIAVILYANSNNTNWGFYGESKDNNNAWTQSSIISITGPPASAVTYYMRLQRLDATTGLISVFSNSARTTHITGSPQCFTIANTCTGLTHVQHGTIPQGAEQRKLYGRIDNMCVDNTTPAISPTAFCCPPGSVAHPTFVVSGIPTATYFCWTFPTGVTLNTYNNADHSSVTVNVNCGTYVSPSNFVVTPYFGGTACSGTNCGYSLTVSVTSNCSCCRIGDFGANEEADKDVSLNGFNLFPNPNNGRFTLVYDVPAESKTSFELYDIAGQFIKRYNLKAGKNALEMENDLSDGMYFYKIILNGEIIKTENFSVIK